MGTGYLKVQTRIEDDALPVAGAHVILREAGTTEALYETYTDANGDTDALALPAPDYAHTLDPAYTAPAYSTWDVEVRAEGYTAAYVRDVQVVDTQTAILPVLMQPVGSSRAAVHMVEIPPVGLLLQDREQSGGAVLGRVLREAIIPDYITVHLGSPGNASARNVRVRFPDYIKNVASSEIYSTWPQASLEANIHTIVTFAVNRVYTEWYRSRGYNFDITNSTAYDQYYRDGGQIYQNISRIVDDIFNVYARRTGFRNPFFTSFCNGTTATCNGLSQWGTVTLANRGMSALQILHYYYPNDLELVDSDNIAGITESYPGYLLREGVSGEPVRHMQAYLGRIRRNYPLIPAIAADGIFGPKTKEAVRAFQEIFGLSKDGIVGRDTWNKISYIYTAVTRLAELESEGERVSIGTTPPTVVLSVGSRGERVRELQFILDAISAYDPTIPYVDMDGIFGNGVRNAVVEFQKNWGLTPDGVVGPATWKQLYSAYHALY